MMRNIGLVCILTGLCFTLLINGCVSPGEVEVDDVYRLQQAMLDRSPQDRPLRGLGLMEPASAMLPPLDIVKDPKSEKKQVKLSLKDAVMRTLANNTDIAVVSYTPQISREQVIQAASEFDYTVFGSVGYLRDDNAFNWKNPVGVGKQTDMNYQVGIQQKTITGATWTLSHSLIRSRDDRGTFQNKKWYTGDIALELTQPLLRGAWPEVNLANLRIARLNYKTSMSQFRQQAEQTTAEVMSAYYQLIQARESVRIANELLKQTEITRERVKGRAELDATKVQIMQAEAAVENRRTNLVDAKQAMGNAQDALMRLLTDPQLNLATDDIEIIPSTPMSEMAVKIDAADQLLTALRLNPQLEQARLAIRSAEINVKVTEWNQLPQLDFGAAISPSGASNRSAGIVYKDVGDLRFMEYGVDLTFSYPLGNRQRLAELAESRLTRLQAITSMQQTADLLAQAIRQQIRLINTSFDNIKIQKKALKASEAKLDGLEQLEKIRASLTPEFLNLKLQAQAEVAQNKLGVLDARMNYNVAQLELDRLTGSILEINQVQLALPVVAQPLDPTETKDLVKEGQPASAPATQPTK